MITLVLTGSHPTPAQAFRERLSHNWRVVEATASSGPKFRRYDRWRSLPELMRLPGIVLFWRRRLKEIKPAAVVSFGGFGSVPVCLAGWSLKIPLVIHEQTLGAGLSSRWMALFAAKIAISWEASRKYFPKNKTVLTGNPLRAAVINLARRQEQVIYITGGHQGSKIINDTVKPLLPWLLKRFTVYHQCGNQPRPLKGQNYFTQAYFKDNELKKIYSRSRLVIGRAGINTVTELAYLKIPAVLIPLPYTQKLEQHRNARYLRRLGLAVTLNQTELTPANLKKAIDLALNTLPAPGGVNFPSLRVKNAANKLFRVVNEVIQAA